jgi:putative ABC transport system permease protein
MVRFKLFYRMIVRPLFREPVRLLLTVLAVALGVAVVLAIDLAGGAAAGSFHSSMETLAGDNDLEVVASGGVPEKAVGLLTALPYALRISPRMEDYAVVVESKETLPLVGVDLIAEGSRYVAAKEDEVSNAQSKNKSENALSTLSDPTGIWIGESLKKHPGDKIQLLINDQTYLCTVRGVYPDSDGGERAIVMDIAGAQRALHRFGRVDRILIKLPRGSDVAEWQAQLRSTLPSGVDIRPQGTATNENRKMLAAFRWNLRLLSYIALIVGAFLIYNTISVSVVRRRAEIGIVRAIGASRANVLIAFLGEAACIGLAGALIALPLGRVMAKGAVNLMALTVESLYVSSRPGPIELNAGAVAIAILIGTGVAVAAALAPAREAMTVTPVEAMARGRRDYVMQTHAGRDLLFALLFAVMAAGTSLAPPVGGKPLFGYVAAVLLILAASFAIPASVNFITLSTSQALKQIVGVEGLLAARSLAASLRRTSVLVAALATAVAMMTSVGIMVGSFRQTVVSWMNDELPADLYIRPAGDPAADRHPTISVDLAARIAKVHGVASVERLRAYEITYDQTPATLASVDLNQAAANQKSDFLSGRPTHEVFTELRGKNAVILSEPFAYKHHLKTGDTITLSLGESRADFHVVDITYDYASERGYILMDRETMLRYLPDPTPSNLAIFVAPNANVQEVRQRIQNISAENHLLIFSDRDLRTEAIRIFDRTFAITYALETVAVIVAVMGIAGALLALVIDRRRELGLLRFLGASAGQVRKLILVEAGLVGMLATLAGSILGFFLSLILLFVINKQSFGWTIHFHWQVGVLLGALTVVYLATLISGIYPALLAAKLDPLEVIHEE